MVDQQDQQLGREAEYETGKRKQENWNLWCQTRTHTHTHPYPAPFSFCFPPQLLRWTAEQPCPLLQSCMCLRGDEGYLATGPHQPNEPADQQWHIWTAAALGTILLFHSILVAASLLPSKYHTKFSWDHCQEKEMGILGHVVQTTKLTHFKITVRKSKKASVARPEWAGGKVVKDEVRHVCWDPGYQEFYRPL